MSVYKGDKLVAGRVEPDINLIHSLHDPDWDRGEYISNPGDRAYTVPERGIVYVADAISIASDRVAMLKINEHIVASMGSGNSYVSSGSFPVDKGDVVSTHNLGSRSSTVLGFVPYKAQ